MNEVDNRISVDGIREPVSIPHLASVDEYRHVLAKRALIVEHVTACALVSGKVAFEDVPERGACNLACRALNVPLDALCESNRRHSDIIPNILDFSTYAHFAYIVSELIPRRAGGSRDS